MKNGMSEEKMCIQGEEGELSGKYAPLHPAKASAPMICGEKPRKKSKTTTTLEYSYKSKIPSDERPASPTRMNRDLVWHVLYDDDLELTRDITLESAIRLENDSSGISEIVSYVELCKNLSAMKALFFVCLNVDEKLREDVCSSQFCNKIWTCQGRPTPLCPYKATRFFLDMEEACIHPWMRNEQCMAAEMVDSLRMLYTIS